MRQIGKWLIFILSLSPRKYLGGSHSPSLVSWLCQWRCWQHFHWEIFRLWNWEQRGDLHATIEKLSEKSVVWCWFFWLNPFQFFEMIMVYLCHSGAIVVPRDWFRVVDVVVQGHICLGVGIRDSGSNWRWDLQMSQRVRPMQQGPPSHQIPCQTLQGTVCIGPPCH